MRVYQKAFLVKAEITGTGIVHGLFVLYLDPEKSLAADGQVGGLIGGFHGALAEIAHDGRDSYAAA